MVSTVGYAVFEQFSGLRNGNRGRLLPHSVGLLECGMVYMIGDDPFRLIF